MIYASADYDGLELRTVAQVCLHKVGFSRLAETLNAGRDPHLLVAATMLGIDYDTALAYKEDQTPAPIGACKGADGIRKWADLVDDARQAGKVANFGFAGGLGPKRLVFFARKAYKVKLTLEEAYELKHTWLRTLPEFVQYFALGAAQAQSSTPTIHLFSNRMRGRVTYCQALNGPFQGLGADATGNAAFLIARASYIPTPCMACNGAANGCKWCRPCHGPGISPMYGARMVNYVHDEFINECCEVWGHEIAHELVRLMVAGAAPYLPDVPPKAKPQLMRYWSKKAKPVWHNGRLIPWPDVPIQTN